jgi:hypothetical protein
LVLDTSALLAYASGASVEPGAMLVLAEEDPQQQVWIPALCLAEAQAHVTGTPGLSLLDLLLAPGRDIQIAVLDGPASRRVARIAARFGVPLHAAHAVATAVLNRCYLVTADAKAVTPAAPRDLDILDITETWS